MWSRVYRWQPAVPRSHTRNRTAANSVYRVLIHRVTIGSADDERRIRLRGPAPGPAVDAAWRRTRAPCATSVTRLDRADDAQVDRLALGQDCGDRRYEEELAAPVASVGTALAAHVARDRRLGVGLQALRPPAESGHRPTQAEVRPHVELIGVTQERRGADRRIYPPRTDADQNEREQGCESCPLRHDGTGSMQSADERSMPVSKCGSKRRGVWNEIRSRDDYALLAVAAAAAMDQERLRMGGLPVWSRVA